MQSFRWDEHYETGIEEVDRQHQKLVAILNNLAECKESDCESIIKTTVEELLDYAQYHFSEEEAMMFKSGIDARHSQMHTNAHKVFVEKIVTISFALKSKSQKIKDDLLDFLTHWLAYHILVTDHNMAHQVKAIETGMRSNEAYDKYESEVSQSVEPLLVALNNLFAELALVNKELEAENESLKKELQELKSVSSQ